MKTVLIQGVEGRLVDVKATWNPIGAPSTFDIVGLSEVAIREARVRTKNAIRESGYCWPDGKLVVAFDPPCRGSGVDLAVALAILEATGQCEPKDVVAWGELSLTGEVRPVPGTAVAAEVAASAGLKLVCSPENANEAARIAKPLVTRVLLMAARANWESLPPSSPPPRREPVDWADIRGQREAKRVLEDAALHGTNVLLVGPPGCGKTMLARRLTSIMPEMSEAEVAEATRVWSVAGLLPPYARAMDVRPFRAPHYTASSLALVGTADRPGEFALAHTGVLMLDELAEFPRHVLEAVAGVVKSRKAQVYRSGGTTKYPASFSLVAAMNPCPCGYHGTDRCKCSPDFVEYYMRNVTENPLYRCFDEVVQVPFVSASDLIEPRGETSAEVRARLWGAK